VSFTSRLEGLLHHVGLAGVVGEVRAMLGYARDNASPRNEVVRHAPPPLPAPALVQTVVEPTPYPRSVAEPLVREPPAGEPIATEVILPKAMPLEAKPPAPPKAVTAGRAQAKKERPVKRGQAPARVGAQAAAPKARKGASSRSRAKPKKSASAAMQDGAVAVSRLVEALRAHPRHEALVIAGRQKDQLVRSLIPLYLARAVEADMEVTSGTMSRFWGELGVTYAAPNAAKALRLHSGYAQDTKKGKAITSRGIQYVEEALERAGSATAR